VVAIPTINFEKVFSLLKNNLPAIKNSTFTIEMVFVKIGN